MGAAEDYIARGRARVKGWFPEVDGWMFLAAHRAQGSEPGGLVEIGCYLGASAILLGYLGEVTVVDLFEDPAPTGEQIGEQDRWYRGLTRDAFEANWRRFHATPPAVLQGRSDERLPSLADGSTRFVHVDGAHAYEAVCGDIVEACRIAGPNAVLAFDDISTHHTPGVSAAVWAAVSGGVVVPLAQTPQKLYATVPGSTLNADRLADAASDTPVRLVEAHDVAGWPVLEVLGPRQQLPRLRRAMLRVRQSVRSR